MSLGQRLRKARDNKGCTQVYVAQMLSITSQALSNYEHDFRDPDTDTLNRLAQFYGVSTDVLLGNEKKGTTGQPAEGDLFENFDQAIERSTKVDGSPLDESTKDKLRENARVLYDMVRVMIKK